MTLRYYRSVLIQHKNTISKFSSINLETKVKDMLVAFKSEFLEVWFM